MMDKDNGNIKEIPVMKLLLSIFKQDLTGILHLKNEADLKVFYFAQGRLLGAVSNIEDEKLENILISKDFTDLETLNRYKQELGVSEILEKILMEKGIVNLEDIIDTSKEQLKRMILRVCNWQEGIFRFESKSPPDNLFNLDINVPDFLIYSVIRDLNMDVVWQSIETLQVEFIKDPEVEKIKKYDLTERQLSLLDSFDGESKLEDILLKYSESQRDLLLKIIYFFMMSGLLIKREFDLSAEPEISEEETVEDLDLIVDKGDLGDFYIFGDTKEKEEIEKEEKEEERVTFIKSDTVNDKKKSKQFNFVFLFVIFILIIGGVIFLLLQDYEGDSDRITQKEKKNKLVDIKEKKIQPDSESAVVVMKKATENEKKSFVVKDKSSDKGNIGLSEQPKTDEVKVQEIDPLSYFKEGNYIAAADAWKQQVLKGKIGYSILLEFDCVKESVVNAYKRIQDKKKFFLLKKTREKKICFLVMWGKFKSREKADEIKKRIPEYFWKQSHPPEIVELAKYLK